MNKSNTLIIIPARLASSRLPNKPLAMIGDAPMIVHVWRCAIKSGIGEVVVACDGDKIKQAIEEAGGRAVVTDPELPSGSDRIYAALLQIDPDKKYDVIINVQGDMPTLDPTIIAKAARLLERPDVDIGTLAAIIKSQEEKNDPAVVKIALRENQKSNSSLADSYSAVYFSRLAIPHGANQYYHHIGIYAYRRAALEHFVNLPPSRLELAEKLEQLRAIEAGMRLDVAIVDAVPLGVDTPEGLEKARKMISKRA